MGKQKILIVDDDTNIRKTLSDILAFKGYEIFSFNNGNGCIESVRQSPVNLVIIDLGLPDMPGLMVLDQVKEINPSTEVIILTGNASLDSAIDATNKGAFSYLLKPFEIDQLMLHIRRALEKQDARELIIRHSRELEEINNRLNDANRELKTEIEERKNAQNRLELLVKEKETLLRELQHRVKNNLNVIHSLLSFELPKLKDEEARRIFMDAQSRILSMSGIYERLYQSSGIDKVELHIYIRDFINSLYEMYVINTLEVRFVTRLEEIFIDLKRAVPLGLILNELITNCLKYAFPEHRKGEIAVEILSKDGNIRVSVSDNGIGLPDGVDPLTATSMGFFLVQMLAEQIEADLTINSSKDRGTEVSLTFKL
jgi:two-component sensor histidine kinase/CheY-like chemotaxis protein